MIRNVSTFCCFLLFVSVVFAQETVQETPNIDPALTVRKISVDGLQEQNEALVLGLIETRIGQEISSDVLTKDIRTLYRDTGLFADVQADVTPAEDGGLEVTYIVQENPKVSGEISIIGHDELNYGKLKPAIKLRPGSVFSESALAKMQREMHDIYLEEGFYLAHIQPEWEHNPDTNTVTVSVLIEEGERIKVGEVTFTGNGHATEKVLREKIQTRQGKRFRDADLKQDLTAITDYYQNHGFMQVEVGEPTKQVSEDRKTIQVEVPVQEGPQFFIGQLNVQFRDTNKPAFSEKKIRKMLGMAEQEIFNKSQFRKGLENIQTEYSDKGYILANVNPVPTYQPDGTVDIDLVVSEGSITQIGDIQLEGLEKTKSYVIKRELERLDIRPGAVYNVDSLRKAHQKIRLLGNFIRSVDFMPSLNATGQQRDLIVQVIENTQTGIFSLGGGYGTEGGLFGLAEIGETNLFGRAYQVHLKGELGTRDRRTAQVRFTTPWLLGTPTQLSVNIYNLKRQRRLYGSYSSLDDQDITYVDERYGASVQVGRPVSRDINLSLRFKDENAKTELPPLLIEDDYEAQRRETRSITFTALREAREYRTSYFDPVGGSYNSLSLEHSGGFLGGDNDFDKFTYDTSWFADSFWKFVLVGHLRAGYLNTNEDPLDLYWERYVLGGIDTVRGYEDFSLLPDPEHTTFDPLLGGNKMYYVNLEYRFPITDMIRGMVFFDMGQVWNEDTTNVFKQFQPNKAVGAGVRFDLFGMLARLEYGYALDRKVDGESAPRGRFHFTIGPAF